MKILLFNDNPVVRKLVALSAQKTKDALSVVWSIDEIEEGGYDLLIIDDALYSDETFESLKEQVAFKSTLLMATRGQAVPAGFDNVINKPFLPTDLVEMFIQIDKKISSQSVAAHTANREVLLAKEEPLYPADLKDTLPEPASSDNEFDSFDLGDLGGELSELEDDSYVNDELDGFEDFEEIIPSTAILDKEEVQEVQGLLDDTEGDDWSLESDITVKGFEEVDEGDSLKEGNLLDSAEDDLLLEGDELGFDDLLEVSAEDTPRETEEDFSDELMLDEEAFGEIELQDTFEEDTQLAEDESEAIAKELAFDEETVLADRDDDLLLNDEELGDLESQIQNAVSGLEAETLEGELDPNDLELDFEDDFAEELSINEKSSIESDDLDGFDELDMLDERELKLAIGEEVDEELNIHTAKGDTSLNAEALDEVMSESESSEECTEKLSEPESASHAEGVEALQTLLRALSNEDVAKSLKGMNISININFGNGA
jgi:uncharacterized membrane protein